MTLQEQLRKCVVERVVCKRKFAKAAGVSLSMIERLINKRATTKLDVAEKILNGLGLRLKIEDL